MATDIPHRRDAPGEVVDSETLHVMWEIFRERTLARNDLRSMRKALHKCVLRGQER